MIVFPISYNAIIDHEMLHGDVRLPNFGIYQAYPDWVLPQLTK